MSCFINDNDPSFLQSLLPNEPANLLPLTRGAFGALPVVILWLGPVVVGHIVHFGEVKRYTWRVVQNDESGAYPKEWKRLDADQVFPLYVEKITGKKSGGLWGCLRLTAHTGWEDYEFDRFRGSYRTSRTGIWIWITWFMHVLLLFMSVAAAAGAALGPHEKEST